MMLIKRIKRLLMQITKTREHLRSVNHIYLASLTSTCKRKKIRIKSYTIK